MILHDKISAQLPEWRERVTKLLEEHGDKVVGEVTISQIYGGMRAVRALVTDISFVDPNEGIRFRGHTLPVVLERLPKPDGAEMPYVGGLYYLLMVGDFPTKEQALEVEAEWAKNSHVPDHVFKVLRDMPKDTHPMALFSQAILTLQNDSKFAKRYAEGMSKMDLWEPALDDAMTLTSKLGVIAAFIYQLKYRAKAEPSYDPNLDFGANFAKMMGVDDKEYADLIRLYFILHSDHESGNVSAHTMHLVGSSLSDIFFAFSAAMNGLAGPLHGLANQNCLAFVMGIKDKFNGVPTKEQLTEYANETLDSGRVIPGYGHAVLRVPDPRYTAQFKFGKEHFPNDELFMIVQMMDEIIPAVLKEQGKAKNPWPNVDAVSGSLQYHYGITEFDFYTVLFGVGRALGVTANYVWARALGQPLERPKSLTTKMLEDIAAG
ncbi:MAG: citrate (Si)-synthase [Anaerolineales bacterium]|uniref:citrate synthase (unknown stereospecificity) n=1 Tax=Candidatus Desulfolinea nitratireducens TaxID=2841698 RepID=A0A8J6NR13_9CHLR|nr:citrate (Si)-synthase [Candidatus Desulfolinea nitratireducens]MBL6959613.1 citrate (Si)-synthase [Anaerolineales bacterium]